MARLNEVCYLISDKYKEYCAENGLEYSSLDFDRIQFNGGIHPKILKYAKISRDLTYIDLRKEFDLIVDIPISSHSQLYYAMVESGLIDRGSVPDDISIENEFDNFVKFIEDNFDKDTCRRINNEINNMLSNSIVNFKPEDKDIYILEKIKSYGYKVGK